MALELFPTPEIGIVGYTAGLIDGEGSIWWASGPNRFQLSIAQSEVNDGEQLVRWLAAEWQIGTVNKQLKQWASHGHYMWHWDVSDARGLQHVLAACLPYLRVKRDKAERCLIWVSQHIRDGARVRWAPGEDSYIRDHWRDEDIDIARVLGRAECGVRHRRRVLGFRKPRGGIKPGQIRQYIAPGT